MKLKLVCTDMCFFLNFKSAISFSLVRETIATDADEELSRMMQHHSSWAMTVIGPDWICDI